jgi:formylglycine-generating enzyme required for sulfatase activity
MGGLTDVLLRARSHGVLAVSVIFLCCSRPTVTDQPAAPEAQSRPAISAGGCTKDTDCKGARVCERGACVEPRRPSSDPGPEAATGRMVKVPAGDFLMGSNDGEADEKPVHRVHVAAFEMDVTEVTVAQYGACVSAGGCPASAKGSDSRGDHPINFVSWDEASTYCAWAEKRLPREEEWEYAARGPDGRKYPWGDEAPGNQLCWNKTMSGSCAVGSFPAGRSPFGLLDMAGNVMEWTATKYSGDHPIKNWTGTSRVIRGGSWAQYLDFDASSVRAARRSASPPGMRASDLGFRCAR